MGKLEVKRSPARVCWHILYNGILIGTAATKQEAEERKGVLERKVGMQ